MLVYLGWATALGVWEKQQGRSLFGNAKKFQLWEPGTNAPNTSQAMFDPYSLTHVSHGLLLSTAFDYIPVTPNTGKITAVGIEAIWEAIENSEWGINNYRTKGYPDYRGDSILNSLSDLGMMTLGYTIGSYMNPISKIVVFGVFDLFLEYKYKDSLSRNVISLIF